MCDVPVQVLVVLIHRRRLDHTPWHVSRAVLPVVVPSVAAALLRVLPCADTACRVLYPATTACVCVHALHPTAKQQLQSLKTSSSQRRQVLDELVHRTAATRTAVLSTELPNVLRIQALTLSHVRAMLECEQRMRLRQLTEIFPLRINAVRTGRGPIQITICNLRLPESANPPSGCWPEPQVGTSCSNRLFVPCHTWLYQG
jgi:hypothetical protein